MRGTGAIIALTALATAMVVCVGHSGSASCVRLGGNKSNCWRSREGKNMANKKCLSIDKMQLI